MSYINFSELCAQIMQTPKQFKTDNDYSDLVNIIQNKSNAFSKLIDICELMESVYPVLKSNCRWFLLFIL